MFPYKHPQAKVHIHTPTGIGLNTDTEEFFPSTPICITESVTPCSKEHAGSVWKKTTREKGGGGVSCVKADLSSACLKGLGAVHL